MGLSYSLVAAHRDRWNIGRIAVENAAHAASRRRIRCYKELLLGVR